jgi:hypothetical protein
MKAKNVNSLEEMISLAREVGRANDRLRDVSTT